MAQVIADIEARLRDIGADRAGDGPSGSHYDPELLDICYEAADYIRDLEAVVKVAREAMDIAAANDACGRNAWEPHAAIAFERIRAALSALERQKEGPR